MTIRSHVANDEYRDGWDRIFGKENNENKTYQPVIGMRVFTIIANEKEYGNVINISNVWGHNTVTISWDLGEIAEITASNWYRNIKKV